MNPIRLAVVGLGRAGYGMHINDELKNRHDKFKITAVCDIIEERRTQVANMFDGCKPYASIEELLLDDDVEMVAIATRSCDHFAHASAALAAGKSVFLEKPMCTNYQDAAELIKISEKPGSPKLYVRHNRRFEENFTYIKDIINSGLLGEVFEINISRSAYSRRDDWQTLRRFGGGQLLNWGPHLIDQGLQFAAGQYTRLWGDIRKTVAAGDCEDHVKISFTGINKILVNITISGGMSLGIPDYQVYGTRGSLEIRAGNIRLKYINPNQILESPVANPETPGASFTPPKTFAVTEELDWTVEDIPCKTEDLSVIWDYLYASFRENEPFPITLAEAGMVAKLISEVKKQSEFTQGDK